MERCPAARGSELARRVRVFYFFVENLVAAAEVNQGRSTKVRGILRAYAPEEEAL